MRNREGQGSPATVTVVIPNWNGLEHLPECFAALKRQTFPSFRVLLVDNASTDESLAWVAANAPEAEVIRMPGNGGFSSAVNAGIRRATTQYVALLNNDTSADPSWLNELVHALHARPDYDIAASRMVFFDRPDLLNAAGDIFHLARLEGRNRGFGQDSVSYSRPRRVFGACAGAALYRRSLFDDIGFFDEDFFLMSEDTDINFRALLAGRKCLYVPGSVIRHKIGGTIKRQSHDKMYRLALRNQAMVVAKNFPTALLPVAAFAWPWRTARAVVAFRPSHWTKIPGNLRALPVRMRSEWEGVRLGLKKRDRSRRVRRLEFLRWVVIGVGPV